MSTIFGYTPPGTIKNFKWLRCVTYWAGGLGMAQAIIWMGLTITGVLSYNCVLPAPATLTYGSVVQTVFYDLYFKGDCQPSVYQWYNTELLDSVQIVQDPWQIVIWEWVYLLFAVAWLIGSVLLLTHVKKDDVKGTVVVLHLWIAFTFCICALDLALGIIFGINYGRFSMESYNYNLNSINEGAINPDAVQLVAGSVTSISMMIISLKGFVLWIINLGLAIFLMVKAICIASDKYTNDTLFMPRQETDDILTTHPPIKAYDDAVTASVGHNNGAFVPEDHRSVDTVELNQEAIARAARMSTDATLQDRRFRNLDTYQQYPPPPIYNNNNNNNRPESITQKPHVTATVAITAFPAPDYSPPMQRANQGQSQNGQMRNQRYQ